MTKKLLVVAASGLVLAILLLSAAWVTGGTALMAAAHRGNWSFDDDDDHRPTATRSYTFDSAAPFTVNAPVELHFVRGDQATMTISGSPAMLAAVHWDHNRLSLNEGLFGDHHSLKVDIVAPQLPPLTFAGAGDVSLVNLDQPEVRLDLSGAGNFEASGKTQTVTVTSAGAGNVDLEHLAATDATVSASGVGNIDLNAGGKVNVNVSGAGNVSLHRKPLQLTSQVSGMGSVDQDY